eukprot:scaffold4097_cov306-Pinguiococcus_pyrenoidosus.AAC.22
MVSYTRRRGRNWNGESQWRLDVAATTAANLVNAADALGLVQVWEADARKDVTLFTMLKVGAFPDLYRKQALKHFAGGSEDSALVACERANDLFKGWGAGYAFYAHLLKQIQHRSVSLRSQGQVL